MSAILLTCEKRFGGLVTCQSHVQVFPICHGTVPPPSPQWSESTPPPVLAFAFSTNVLYLYILSLRVFYFSSH